MGLFRRIFGDQRIDDWASDYTLIAARTLNQVAADLIVCAEQEIAQAGWKDGLIGPTAFVNERIAPLVRSVAEPAALQIVEEANAALLELVEAQAVWVREPEQADGPASMLDGVQDVAAAVVPLAAGAATVAALPFAAVTTTTAMFGLVTTTAISWPVVVGGGALAGLGLATGVLNTAKIWEKTEARLRERVRRFILATLIDGTDAAPSILQQLGREFALAARKAKAL